MAPSSDGPNTALARQENDQAFALIQQGNDAAAEKFKAKRAARAATGGGRRRERTQASAAEVFTDAVDEEPAEDEEAS